MPYYIKKFKDGYKVCKKDETKCFSKKPIPLERAKKQMKAIGMRGGAEEEEHIELIKDNDELEGSGIQALKKRLKNIGVSLKTYLNIARRTAKKRGYDPELLKISEAKGKKLNYNGVNFGSSDNNDFIIYSLLAKKGKITKEEAKLHRKAYRARATKIKGDWKSNKESPNNLAIKILW
jgi:hypothetical protein